MRSIIINHDFLINYFTDVAICYRSPSFEHHCSWSSATQQRCQAIPAPTGCTISRRQCSSQTRIRVIIVFCYQNCSDLLWEKIVPVNKKNRCKFIENTRTIYSNSERPEQFLVTECFFNLRFLISNKLELEKIIDI